MSCIITNIFGLNNLNTCAFSVPGLNRLLIAPFTSDLYSKLVIDNNTVVDVDASIKFIEVDFNKGNSRYSEIYNIDTKKYEGTLQIELVRFDYEKRSYIDSLIKAKLVFIFQDKNGKYFLMGEKSGASCISYSAGTDVARQGKSNYLFNFFTKADYSPFGVSNDIIDIIDNVDCSILDDELALSSPLFWLQYQDCLIGDLDDFVEP